MLVRTLMLISMGAMAILFGLLVVLLVTSGKNCDHSAAFDQLCLVKDRKKREKMIEAITIQIDTDYERSQKRNDIIGGLMCVTAAIAIVSIAAAAFIYAFH